MLNEKGRRRFYVTQYALIVSDHKILMVKDKCPCFAQNKWCLPGGHIDMELDPLKALKRELKEETNLDLQKAFPVKTNIYKYSTGLRYRVFFKCTVKGKIKLSHEHDEYKWMSKKDVKNILFRDKELKKIVLKFLR